MTDLTQAAEQALEQQAEPVHDLYDEGFRRGLEMSSSYKEEAKAYKEAYFNLVKNVASMKAFEPTPPIVLYTPPALQHKLLTEEEIWELWNAQGDDAMDQQAAIVFARSIQAKIKQKNNT